MKRLTTVLTLFGFVFTLALSGPVLAEKEMDGEKKDYDGEKHSMMKEKMHKKHMMKMMKDHDKRNWRDWRGDRRWNDDDDWEKNGWDKDDWKRDRDDRWDRDHDDKDYDHKRKHDRDDDKKDKEKHSIHMMYKMVKHHLDLSDEQNNQLSDLYFETKLELIDRKAEKKKRHVELKHLKHADDVDQSEVMDKIDELYSAKASLKKTTMSFHMDVKDMLDESQLEQLKKHHHKRHGDRGKHMKDKDDWHGKKEHDKKGDRDEE